jgi:hypothetical protein
MVADGWVGRSPPNHPLPSPNSSEAPQALRIHYAAVGDENELELNKMPGSKEYPLRHFTLAYAAKGIGETGFQIIQQQEAFPLVRFYDIGAVVYYLKAIPWQVPDFSIDSYIDALWDIHQRIQRDGFIEAHDHRFLIVARKP